MDYEKQYHEYLARVNRALEAACNTYLPEESEVCRAARYSLMSGGKRIRAVLVLSVCDMLHGNAEAAEQFAAAVEMLHCYSLIHDDLPCMDNDDLRRGKPSCHKAVGEATAMLAGDVPVGRKLDFLVQEINRECNTIGSKCNDLTIAQDVVNMKAEVEKIREQIQNIE